MWNSTKEGVRKGFGTDSGQAALSWSGSKMEKWSYKLKKTNYKVTAANVMNVGEGWEGCLKFPQANTASTLLRHSLLDLDINDFSLK